MHVRYLADAACNLIVRADHSTAINGYAAFGKYKARALDVDC